MKKNLISVALLINGYITLNAQTVSVGDERSHNDQFYVGREVSITFSGQSMILTPTDGYGEARTYDIGTNKPLVLSPNKVEVIQLRHPNSIDYSENDGITSYVCTSSLNFSGIDGDLKAYIAVSSDETSITLAPKEEIKARDAFVVRGEVGYYCIPVTMSDVDYGTGIENILKGALVPQDAKTVTSSDKNVYALGEYGTFAKITATPGNPITIPVKKAYLVTSNNSLGKTLSLDFSEDIITSIDKVSQSQKEEGTVQVFNILGQTVSKDYRGIVIKNRKKYIHK